MTKSLTTDFQRFAEKSFLEFFSTGKHHSVPYCHTVMCGNQKFRRIETKKTPIPVFLTCSFALFLCREQLLEFVCPDIFGQTSVVGN